ncbi:MAG: class I SAM-dependent methyltransferase [Opitutales bacterium]
MTPRCFICGGGTFDHVTPQYRRCTACGHETLAGGQTQAYIVNEKLEAPPAARASLLERFQGAVLERFSAGRPRGRLVDIGSGAGRFLARQGGKFQHCCGVEITPAAVEFARRKLGLTIVGDLAAVEGGIDVATAWHSLEHFPAPALGALLAGLQAKVRAGGCVIVSVPNAASFQYRCLRERSAFFDVPSHLHQFTPDSLGRLFQAHGFVCTGTAVSWPYNAFGWIQGLLNVALPGHNYLYYRLKRGHPRASVGRDLAGLLLLPAAGPLGLGLGLLEAARPARQAVLTCCFEKRA